MSSVRIIVNNQIDGIVKKFTLPLTTTGLEIIKIVVGNDASDPHNFQLLYRGKTRFDFLVVEKQSLSEINAEDGDKFTFRYDPIFARENKLPTFESLMREREQTLNDYREREVFPSESANRNIKHFDSIPKREARKPTAKMKEEEPIIIADSGPDKESASFGVSYLYSEAIQQQLRTAYRKFDFQNIMKVGIPYDVKLEIMRDTEKLIEQIRNRLKEIHITDMVKVSLKGEDFTITPYFNNEKQFIPNTGSAEWNWKVTPQKRGTKTLIVQISTTLKHEVFGFVERDFPLYSEEVTVKINPSYSLIEGLKKNWQWIIGTIVGTGVIWKLVEHLLGKTS